MKQTITIVAVFLVVSLYILSLIKVDTDVYVGTYFHLACTFDIQLKIDDELIFKDSLHGSNFLPAIFTCLTPKMKYGFHTIKVVSKEANVNQENRIFLFPFQYIYVEFIGADTLCTRETRSFNFEDGTVKDLLCTKNDSVQILQCKESTFIIKSLFKPYHSK